MHDDEHKNTPHLYKHNLLEPLNMWPKRAKQPLKSGFLGVKSRYLGVKNSEWATNQKAKMVQNAGNGLKFGVRINGANPKNVPNSMFRGLYSRQNEMKFLIVL